MKNHFKVALAALAVAGFSGAAHADLSLQGAVGLPLNPTAQVPQQNGARVQLNYNDLGNQEFFGGLFTFEQDQKLYSLTGSIRAGNSPFEIHGGIHHLRTKTTFSDFLIPTLGISQVESASDSNTGFSIGAKYLFSRETDPANVRLAAGIGYSQIGPSEGEVDNTFGYVVASKYLTQAIDGRIPIIGHLGLRYDNWDGDSSFNDSDGKLSVYGGVEVPLTRRGEFQFVGELQSKNRDGGSAPYSASLRYRRDNQPFGASIGIARTAYSDDSGLFAQIGYTFDTK